MHLLLVGLSHATAPVSLRERVSVGHAATAQAVRAAARRAGLHETVVLSTCNRTELYGAAVSDLDGALARAAAWLADEADVPAAELSPNLYTMRDAEVVTHLFRVAAGLDSLVMGEPQILGQVGAAYELAHDAGATGARLSRLFLGAVEVGKQVRSSTTLGATPVSVATIALQLGRRLLGELEGKRILLVGAGEMCEVAGVLASERSPERLVVVNRTFERAEGLARRIGGEARPWTSLAEELARADLVLTSTGAPEPVITQADLASTAAARGGERVVVVDMGVPRDVEPSCGCVPEVFLYDIDDLGQIAEEHIEQRKAAIPQAEQIVERARERYLAWQESLAVVPTIVALRERFEAVRAAELRQHLGKVHGLDEAGVRRVEQLTEAIINKLLHVPTARLKRRAGDGMGTVLAASIRYLFALDDEKDGA